MSRVPNRHHDGRDMARLGASESAFDEARTTGDPFEAIILAEIERPIAAPDMTAAIMGRLGYRRVSARRARMNAMARLSRRSGFAVLTVAALVVGAYFHDQSPRALRPSGPTIPAALHGQWHQQRQYLDNMVERCRHWTAPVQTSPPPTQPAPAPPPAPGSLFDRSAAGPMRRV